MSLRTFQPKKIKRIKTHGFFARKKRNSNVLSNRRKKGRKSLTVSSEK